MKKSVKIAFCGLTTALSVVLLMLGGIIGAFAYTMPMLAGLFMIMMKNSFNTSGAIITYASTSIISMLIVADKECALMYIFFFGYYPLIQLSLNRIKSKLICWFTKLVIFNIMITICQLILVFVFGAPILEEGEGKYFILVFAILMNILLIIYDLSLGKLRILYELKVEKLLKKYLK